MGMAVKEFAVEYGIATKSLGPNCKLFVQKQWNSSSWTEIHTTEFFCVC